jgi:hypothetical protein
VTDAAFVSAALKGTLVDRAAAVSSGGDADTAHSRHCGARPASPVARLMRTMTADLRVQEQGAHFNSGMRA